MSCKKNYVATLLIALMLGIGTVQLCICHASDLVGSNGKYVSVLNSQVMEVPPKPDKLGKMAQKNYAKAEAGDAELQFLVAMSYRSGIGEYPLDNKAACYWFRRAAVQGSVKAQFELAQMFGKGDGVEKNIPEAMYWYDKVANALDADEVDNICYSKMKLGDYYYTGIGCKQDFSKAYEYYRQASHVSVNDRYDKAKIFLRLGLCSMYGRGCSVDGELAIRTFDEIVKVKDKYDKYYGRRPQVSLNYHYLARCYYEGIGCQKDIKLAQKYFAQAKKMIPDLNDNDVKNLHEDTLELILLKEMIPYAEKVLAEKA